MPNKLGNYLRELRGKNSLREIASRTNGELSHSYISDLEKGVSRRGNIIKPSPETLKILSNVYNANYEYLMELAGYKINSENPVLTDKQQTVAAHIDDDVNDEEMKEILNFIDYIKNRDKK